MRTPHRKASAKKRATRYESTDYVGDPDAEEAQVDHEPTDRYEEWMSGGVDQRPQQQER